MAGKGDTRRPEARKGSFDDGHALIQWPSDAKKPRKGGKGCDAGEMRVSSRVKGERRQGGA